MATVANPSISLKTGGKRGKSVPLARIDQQIDWLLQRSEKNGFKVLPQGDSAESDLRIANRKVMRFSKNPRDHKRTALTTVRFEGTLEVTDAEALRATLTQGIGKGRAYGLGLMTLARR